MNTQPSAWDNPEERAGKESREKKQGEERRSNNKEQKSRTIRFFFGVSSEKNCPFDHFLFFLEKIIKNQVLLSTCQKGSCFPIHFPSVVISVARNRRFLERERKWKMMMASSSSSSSATVRVDKATSDLLIGPDWTMNMDICDSINSNHWYCFQSFPVFNLSIEVDLFYPLGNYWTS